MEEIVCYDTRKKRRINRLYQWDRDFSITVTGIPISPLPVFQFANRKKTITIDRIPEITESGLVCVVPNELLEMAEPLFIYFYTLDSSNQRNTIASIHIPIRPRMRPSEESLNSVTAHYVKFMSDDGSIEYGRFLVIHGNPSPDPIAEKIFEIPNKHFSVEWEGSVIKRHDYKFDGWSLSPGGEKDVSAFESVDSDVILYARFIESSSLCALPFPDMNKNGILDNEDVNIILDEAVEVGSGLDGKLSHDDKIRADIDCDGVTTAKDARTMLNFLSCVSRNEYENSPRGWNEFMRDEFSGEDFYNVEFYVDGNLVMTVLNILRNGGAIYPVSLPDSYIDKDGNEFYFQGWYPKPEHIKRDTKCYAMFLKGGSHE